MLKRLTAVALLVLVAASATAADKKPAQKKTTGTKKAAATKKTEAKPKVNPLLDPSKLTKKAPDVFLAKFETTKGPFTIEVHRAWAPVGADRFYNLVANGFYDNTKFFRVISGFMAQFGIHADPAISRVWYGARIQDDKVIESNTRGMVSFATSGPNSRTTQLFINFGDNSQLDGMDFSPFGKVIEGMEVVDALYSGYGEGAPRGRGPDQMRIQNEGNAYLNAAYPNLDTIKTARILKK
jgi:peptidyl-prolyl cis-trans isomerase A (cyclophilin A)